ncbi:kinase-like protein [Rhizophagus irregularis]|uniref:Kinase-like protein n=1 Tax=Rhizophagus irregularis TaxID=588596 RepID=A0A2N1N459_9GLOM|nr:kinase-like protein [Rhizophagus irregularis]
MGIVNPHPNIITFYGVTKLDETNYSLVLEYADKTLRDYLRDDTIPFKWESQLRFAREIANAISWLHDDKEIIHGDLHPNNILINDGKIKVADFGRSCQKKGSVSHTKAYGVIPYMDPKFFEQNLSSPENQKYGLTEKSDIYSLGVLFWELTSRSSPFNFEKKGFDRDSIKLMILNRVRENPIPKTNDKFVSLYKKCWQHEPDERPPICQLRLEESDTKNTLKVLLDDETLRTIHRYEPQDFKDLTEIASGASAFVYYVRKNTSKFAIKKFKNPKEEAIIKENAGNMNQTRDHLFVK